MNTFLSDHNLVHILLKFNPAKGLKACDVKKWNLHSFRSRKLDSADYDARKEAPRKSNGTSYCPSVRKRMIKMAPILPHLNKLLIIRQKTKAKYLALKAENPFSDKVEKL